MSETKDTALVPLAPGELPEPVVRRGINEAQWRTLANNLFPGAATSSVLMVWDYCTARGLDPMKKPCHIVPMEVKDAKTGEYGWRDVVMPGIYEYRITAHRTGEYLGHSEPEYGPDKQAYGVMAPEWCRFVVYRWNSRAHEKVEYPAKIYFAEVVATRKNKQSQQMEANSRWSRAPHQMLAKCAEAAALREAFPEEIGGEPTADEMTDQRAIDATPTTIDAEIVKTVNLLDKLPEGLRDNVEKQFSELGLAAGLRLAKVNEHMGGDGVDPEAGAQAILDWCRDEFAKRKTGQPRVKKGNAKAKADDAKPTHTGDVPPDTDGPRAEEPRSGVSGDKGVREGSPKAPDGNAAAASPVAPEPPLPQESELF